MYTITYYFESIGELLDGRYLYPKGFHGLLYNITGQTDREASDRLHQHPAPRPFTLVPLYTAEGLLAGLRLSAITDETADLFNRTGEWFSKTQRPCHLGGREFIIKESRCTPAPNWQQLALSEPVRQMGLRFSSPTAFKQGPGHLPLPLPVNVFMGPVRIWEAFAPPMMSLPPGWLDWCSQFIFVNKHAIETVQVKIGQREYFTGFVGDVWFEAHKRDEANLRAWQALGTIASFCGVGHKATMGMGAVERITY